MAFGGSVREPDGKARAMGPNPDTGIRGTSRQSPPGSGNPGADGSFGGLSAFAEVEANQILVGDAGFFGKSLEMLDQVHTANPIPRSPHKR